MSRLIINLKRAVSRLSCSFFFNKKPILYSLPRRRSWELPRVSVPGARDELGYIRYELNVYKEITEHDKITASCPTNKLLKHNISRYKHLKQTLKNCLANKLSKLITSIRPFCSSSSLSICATFVFAVIFIPSFKVLRDYFYISLKLVAVPAVRIFIKFVTQLLYM